MRKIWQHLLLLSLLITAMLACAPAALAAAEYETSINGAKVTITNNYGASDTVTLVLNAPAESNTVYWVYLPGPVDKTAQLGSITIKKGAISGKISVSAGRLSDFSTSGGSVYIVTGSTRDECTYGPVEATPTVDTSKVTLRNSPTGAEMLIVDGSVVTKGMTVYAIVNGKVFKATAAKDGVALQVNLPGNMEVGAPVWYTIAAAGCTEINYTKLTLGSVKTSDALSASNIKLFFQGDGLATSSLIVTGLSAGDKIRCYTSSGANNKTVSVANNSTMATISGLRLSTGEAVYVAITKSGETESPTTSITASAQATTALKTASATNSIADGATITVKNVTEGDTVTLYNANGFMLTSKVALEDDEPADSDDPDAPDTDNDIADVVFEGIDLGLSATTAYVSVTTSGKGESAWLKVTVPVAKATTPTP